MAEPNSRSRGSRVLFDLACVVVVIFGLRAASGILVPVALAFILTVLSLPLLTRLRAGAVPGWLAVFVTLLVNVAVLVLLLLLVSHSANEVRLALPRYFLQLQQLVLSAEEWLLARQFPVTDGGLIGFLNPEHVVGIVTATLRGITWTVSNGFLVILLMTFMLIEAASLPVKLRAALGDDEADLDRFAKVNSEVQKYLVIKTVVSMITGLLVGVWLWFLGVDFPLFWGLMAFLFNYVPSIGSILASIPPILLALVQHGIATALLVALGYLIVNVALGNVIEPNLMGRRLGLSTLVVILSLVFWGWVWGPVGMLLALPMTMVVKIMLENTADLRWLAILLGPAPSRERPVGSGNV